MPAVTYEKAGVHIDRANDLVKSIKILSERSARRGVIGSIGGFSGLFRPAFGKMKDPVLAASTDGVGTKLIVANIAGKHDTIGIDLVAMNVNDLICSGAEPLFFLDYFACGSLDNKKTLEVLKGVSRGCREAGVSLLGGETAELPGLYKRKDYDLAGFSVGIVDRKKIIDGSNIKNNDVVLGIASSGIHSNGYSLVRKVFTRREIKGKYSKSLLKPTRIYVKGVLSLIKSVNVKGIAHITGGGFYDNIRRILPGKKSVVINPNSWPVPEIFKIIKSRSGLDDSRMFRTFNMGIGMVLVVARKDVDASAKILSGYGLESYLIGEVVRGMRKVVI